MTTHNDLWIVARARMHLLEHEIAEMRRTARPRQLRSGLFAANALHKASVLLLSLSRRLECYADRLLAKARSQRWDESLNNPC